MRLLGWIQMKPPITPFEDLDIKLHEPWFPIEITQSFIFDEYSTIARVNYNESTSKYMVKIEKNDYTSIKKFNVRSEHRYYGFKDILEGALNSTIPYITKGSKDYKRIDRAKMQEIKIKLNHYGLEVHRFGSQTESLLREMRTAELKRNYLFVNSWLKVFRS